MMIFRHVPLVQWCYVAMGWIPDSSAYYQECVVSYCYVLSDHALKTDATHVLKWVMLIRSGELLGMSDWRPRFLSQAAERQ
jgi:hypothetical protein